MHQIFNFKNQKFKIYLFKIVPCVSFTNNIIDVIFTNSTKPDCSFIGL